MQEHNMPILSQAEEKSLGVCRDFTRAISYRDKEKVQTFSKEKEKSVSQAPYGTLMGRPVIPIEVCQTMGTSGDIILADLSQYIMIDKGGLQSASSIHVKFTTDETAFRFVFRCDGSPWWSTVMTPFKGSATLSPFVVLT